jgi:hypothetical protein
MSRINPFILAHGSSAGPLMRPLLTGFIAGESAGLLVFFVLWRFQILEGVCARFGTSSTVIGYGIFGAVTGIVYGWTYRRAANDHRGGWIFGASTGFIFWMLNPIIWLPWFGLKPLLIGTEAVVFMVSHVLYGLFLGFLFPWVHRWTTRKIDSK